jgi:hypothetical protein
VSRESERSWRLKIARAEHHLAELRHLVEAYKDGHHYRAVCPNPPPQPTQWRFVLEITEPPDPQIAIVLGDLLFNVRSALDHIAVACARPDRKRQAGFPLFEKRPEGGDQEKFGSMTTGMASEAVAVIEYEQPYNVANRTSKIGPESVEALFALSALQNADKHRGLADLVAGISDPRVQVSWDDGFGAFRPTYVEPGELLISYDEFGNRIPYDQVTVEVRGVPHVAVNVSRRGDYELPTVAEGILGRVRERVIPSLEPFVRI